MSDEDPTSGSAPEPGEDAPTFDAPWQARSFVLAVALTDEDDLPWREFQFRLVDEIDADEGESTVGDDPEPVYYRQWLAALEQLLVDRDLVDPGEFADRVDAFEAGDRTAYEFVVGIRHAHADRLPEGYAEGTATTTAVSTTTTTTTETPIGRDRSARDVIPERNPVIWTT